MHTTALVLFSGGQDSATCLAHALDKYDRVETIAFDYGQRHRIELDARLQVLQALRAQFPAWASKLGDDHLLDLSVLGQVSETSLTRDMEFRMEQSGLPNTFVPGRNLLFLTLAAALAYRRGLEVIVTQLARPDRELRAQGLPHLQPGLQLDAMPLAIVERDGFDTLVLVERVGQAGGGVLAAGKKDECRGVHLQGACCRR